MTESKLDETNYTDFFLRYECYCYSCGYNMRVCCCGSNHKYVDGVCSRCHKNKTEPTLGCFYLSKSQLTDKVNHPAHYGGDSVYETIKVIEAWELNFNLGNTVKYISRAGKKDNDIAIDLEKARFYLDREIKKLRGTK